MAKSIVLQSATRHSGKSFIITALLRILHDKGLKVVPFEAETFSKKYVVLENGFILSKSVVRKAKAINLEPEPFMNPVLLIPENETHIRIILDGSYFCTIDKQNIAELKKTFDFYKSKSYDFLSQNYDIIIEEGFVNPYYNNKSFGLVDKAHRSPVVLITDFDNGMGIANLLGTLKLIDDFSLQKIKGIIINKIKGKQDNSIFKNIEAEFLKKFIGAVPLLNYDLYEDENNTNPNTNSSDSKVNICIVSLPNVDNFDDFSGFSAFNNVNISYVSNFEEFEKPDFLIIPDTKNPNKDLIFLRDNNFENVLTTCIRHDVPILAIDRSLKILSNIFVVNDSYEGFGILPIDTEVSKKVNRKVSATMPLVKGVFKNISNQKFKAIEYNRYKNIEAPILSNQNIYGTTMHKLFDNINITTEIINTLYNKKNIINTMQVVTNTALIEERFLEYVKIIESSIDIDEFCKILF